MTPTVPPRPTDATLSVTKAARILGVHPNTVRAWSDAGRLRYYRINPRGDRRYRLGDLQRFLSAAESQPTSPPGAPSGRARWAVGAQRPGASIPTGSPIAARDGSPADPLEDERHRRDLGLLDVITREAASSSDLDDELERIVHAIRDTAGHALVVAWELRGDRLAPKAAAVPPGIATPPLLDLPSSLGISGRVLRSAETNRDAQRDGPGASGGAVRIAGAGERVTLAWLPSDHAELAVAIPGTDRPWGVLLMVAAAGESFGPTDIELARVLASAIGAVVRVAHREEEVSHLLHRAEALRRVAGDIGSRLDLDRILAGLVDHAMVLFDGDRAAVFLRRPDGQTIADVSRGLSAGFLAAARSVPARSLSAAAVSARRPLFSVGYRDDLRGADERAVVVQEGFDTLCTAPLMDGTDLLGLLNVYHDAPHAWTGDELETVTALATQASVAIRAAQDYQQMSTWTAQLQSIQQLGARLNHLSNVRDIGLAIATELRQLIDYHNVRVYRVAGTDLVPVAMKGQVGEYVDETPDQLRVAVGEGITGWVAEHGIAQNLPDASADPRASTIPGTEDDLDESMLLAPMLFEHDVLGVLVLAEARAGPVHRRRPAAARHLRQLRRPGHGQRRHDPAAARAVERAGAPVAQPARAHAHHRDDPHDARCAGRHGRHHRSARRPHRLRQHRHRGRRSFHRAADPDDGPRRPCRPLPRTMGAGRDRHRDVGRRAQRTGVRGGRTRQTSASTSSGHSRSWTAVSSSCPCAAGPGRSGS